MDPLSDVLSLLKLRSYWSAGFDFGGDWCIGFEAYDGIRFYAAFSGTCWLAMEGVSEAVRITAGDCVIFRADVRFVLRATSRSRRSIRTVCFRM